MGWEVLQQWGDDAARVEPLGGGVVNEVWSVRVNGQLAVGRLGSRNDADLAWETDLLRHLDREGLRVPVPIPTRSGQLFADRLMVMSNVEGEPPETEADWRRVADSLRRLHRVTHGWPQRPGWRSSIDLLHADTGTKIDLGAMPPEGVARCRAAWERLAGHETCVIHSDPTPGNIRMTFDSVGIIDWDESHVDVEDLDLLLPHNAADLSDGTYDIADQAFAACDAARCWGHEFAVRGCRSRAHSSASKAVADGALVLAIAHGHKYTVTRPLMPLSELELLMPMRGTSAVVLRKTHPEPTKCQPLPSVSMAGPLTEDVMWPCGSKVSTNRLPDAPSLTVTSNG